MSVFIAHIYFAIVINAFLCSLISFRLHYPYHLRLFAVFLGITALTETVAIFVIYVLHLSNFPVYNLFTLIQYTLLAFYFKQLMRSQTFKKIINVFLILYPLFWASIFLFVYTLNQWNSYGIMVGDLFIIIFSARYLYELFTSETLISFKKHSGFWIAVALIFFSSTELPITGILNYLVKDWQHNKTTVLNLYSILQVLNIVMYSLFIYAYLCRIKRSETK